MHWINGKHRAFLKVRLRDFAIRSKPNLIVFYTKGFFLAVVDLVQKVSSFGQKPEQCTIETNELKTRE
jgi:hypothetical protein